MSDGDVILTGEERRKLLLALDFVDERLLTRNGQPQPVWVALLRAKLGAGNARRVIAHVLDAEDVAVSRSERIDVAEAARRLGIHPGTVRKRCQAGTLPAERVGKRAWLISWEVNGADRLGVDSAPQQPPS